MNNIKIINNKEELGELFPMSDYEWPQEVMKIIKKKHFLIRLIKYISKKIKWIITLFKFKFLGYMVTYTIINETNIKEYMRKNNDGWGNPL